MKYIKKFESFDAKPVSKELSNVYKSAIENRFATLDGSSTDTEEVIIAPPNTNGFIASNLIGSNNTAANNVPAAHSPVAAANAEEAE